MRSIPLELKLVYVYGLRSLFALDYIILYRSALFERLETFHVES